MRVKQAFDKTDPISLATQAIIDPMSVPRGLAGVMNDSRVSQKLTCRGQTVIAIPAAAKMVFMVSPNLSSTSTSPSVIIAVETSAGTFTTTSYFAASGAGLAIPGGTMAKINTATPYSGTYLYDNNIEFALAGCGVRFTYDGPELYRGGTFRYYHDLDEDFTNAGAVGYAALTPLDLIAKVDEANNSIRQSINKNNEVEINAYTVKSGGVDAYSAVSNTNATAYSPNAQNGVAQIGGLTSGTLYFGNSPMLYGYYVNPGANAVSFHVEVIEHWAVHGGTIQSLQTPSVSNVGLHDQVTGFLSSSRQSHSTKPNAHHLDVMKTVISATKTPIGGELLKIALNRALA